MKRRCVNWLFASVAVGTSLVLGACAHHHGLGSDDEAALNVNPTNYRADILAAMHAYLNDPTGIRDAAISQPMQKSVSSRTRYVVCLRYNGKKSASEYVGVKEIAAVFLAGRFDQFVEQAREICAGANYAPFPELETLSR